MHKIHETRQYDKFDGNFHNRPLRKLDELMDSMREFGFIPAYPLHVRKHGNKYRIIGGHNRFESGFFAAV